MNNKKGFTLVELLVVIAIIGILALLILPNFISSFRNANNKAMITQENEVVDATKLFVEDYCRHPLKQNKGLCSTYSVKTQNTNQKYTCLSTLQTTKYMEDIVSQGQFCSGFVVYNKNYSEYKAYLKCGNGYATEGIDEIMDSHNNKLIDICLGEITPEPDDPTVAENFENTTTHKIYETLESALYEVQSNQTILVLEDTNKSGDAKFNLSNGPITGVTLDLNGHTTSGTYIRNTGVLVIDDSSDGEGSFNESIFNSGTLTIKKGKISPSSYHAVQNSGTLFVTGGTLSAPGNTRSGIYNTGTVTITGGSIAGNTYGVWNNVGGNVTINGTSVQISSTSYFALNNEGTASISSGNLNSNSNYAVNNTGTITISGGTIYGSGAGSCGMDNKGTATITGGNIKGENCGIINNSGALNISGNSHIEGENQQGIMNSSHNCTISGGTITGSTGISNTGTLTVTGGTIIGRYTGLSNYGTLTLGTNDSNVSTTSPVIISQITNSSNQVGLENYGESIVNFYDGIIKSYSGINKTISGAITNVPSGYEVYKETVDGIGLAYLKRTASPTYTATFYYNSNTTAGSLTVSTSTATCIPSSGSCTVEIPPEVTSSVGKYNSAYKGVSTSTGNMNSTSLTISANTTFYANYSKQVLVYYYGTSYISKNYYRNEFFTSTTAMASRLATSNTGTANYSTSTGPGSSVWYGLSTGKDAVREYETVQQAANSRDAQLYSVYSFNVAFEKGANVSEIGSTSNHCEVTSTNTSCEIVLPSITPASGYASVGWNTTSGATTGTDALGTYELSSNGTTLYANAMQKNYQNTTTNKYYATLNSAFNEVANNQTIKVIQNVTETETATLDSGKTGIKLDLNGKKISSSASIVIDNKGTLDIYNSASANAIIEGTTSWVLSNNGNLSLNKTNNNNSLTIKVSDTISNPAINNYSNILEINKNTKILSNLGIFNWGTINMIDGAVTGGSNALDVQNGVVNISGGNLSADIPLVIHDKGKVTITGGNITGNSDAIRNHSSISEGGFLKILGGSIVGNGDAILNTGNLILGTDDSTVNTTSPLIQTTGTNNKYGIYNNAGTINFYDGIIKSSSGTGYAISGTVAATPTGYNVYKETTSGVESAYLKANSTYTATFYYNSNTTAGSLTVSTATASCTTTGTSCTVTVPSVVTNSVGKYNSPYKGVINARSSMSSSSLTISGDPIFYANYSKSVQVYYYGTSYTSKTYYRNEYFTSNTSMESRLAASNTETTNYTTATGPGSSTWYGLSTGKDAVREYSTVQQAANSSATTLYSVYSFNVSFLKGSNVTAIGSTSNHCEVTSTNTSCSIVLPSITPTDGYVSVGWNTTSGATTGTAALASYTLSSNSVRLYANAKSAVGTLMAGTSGDATTNFLRTTIAKQNIESLTFSNSKSGHSVNGTDCFDVSKDEDGGVLAWVTDSNNNGKYEMTIGANGTVYASSGYYLFANLVNLNSLNGLNYFDTSNVTYMYSMFNNTGYSSSTFTLNLGNNFDTSKVTSMGYMFANAGYSNTSFKLNLGSKFDTSNVRDMSTMFSNVGHNNTTFTFDLGDKFDTSNVTNMGHMFFQAAYNSTNLTVDLGDKFDTSKVTNMYMMFYALGYNSSGFNLDLGNNFNTSSVTDMRCMFYLTGNNDTSFTLKLGDKFNTSSVTLMSDMFHNTGYKSTRFTLDLGDKFDTSNVTDMSYMFTQTGYSNTSFTLDLGSKFDTSQVKETDNMFAGTGYSSTRFTLNLGDKFDTSNVTDMGYMFSHTGYSSTTFTLNLGNKFDTSKVTKMYHMFYYTGYSNRNFTLDLGAKFNTSNVVNFNQMFYGSRYLKTIKAPTTFVISADATTNNMFKDCTSLVGGSGTRYSASYIDGTRARIDGGTSNPGYFTSR